MYTNPRIGMKVHDEFGKSPSSKITYADVDAMANKK